MIAWWSQILAWLENSLLAETIRGAGVWSYGIINLIHILGIASLFGAVLLLDLRLLGWRKQIALASVTAITLPIAALGFSLAVLSGICMLAVNATDYIGNPFLPIKLTAIALALLNAFVLSRQSAWQTISDSTTSLRDARVLAFYGGASLLCWLTAIAAGRMIGYW